MNKQELIDELKKLLAIPSEIEGSDFDYGYDFGIERAITLAEQLDEQGKVVVPQFVADWIEWCKKNKITLLGADTAICNNKNIRSLDASGWAWKNQETFAKAWLYGYEIEKVLIFMWLTQCPFYFIFTKFKQPITITVTTKHFINIMFTT